MLAAASVLVMVAQVAGCGGKNEIVVPSDPAGAPANRNRGDDPCRLLRQADVAYAYAMPFTAGVPSPGAARQCEFRVDSSDPATPTVSLHVTGEITVEGFETARLAARADAQVVGGVGDQAYFRAQEGRLFVREGVFGFDIGASPHFGRLEQLAALARVVVKRHN